MSSDLLLAYLKTTDLLNWTFLLFYMEVFYFQNFKILEIVNFLMGIQHSYTFGM